MPLWDPTHPGPLYQGGVGREEGRPSDRQDHHGATVPKGGPGDAQGCQDLPEQGVNGTEDRTWEGIWQKIHFKSKSEFCSILPRISVGPHLYAPLGSYTFCTKISISEYLSID